MKNLVLVVLGFSMFFISCDKSIHGKIIDNFDKPVANVDIKIKDSGFHSVSDKNGSFKIDFAAGKFTLMFQKHNYIAVNKVLEIAEQKSYPLGQINLIRLPDSSGLYFKGVDDFNKIPQISLKSTQNMQSSMWAAYILQKNYYLPYDSIHKILIDSLKEVSVFDLKGLSLILVEAPGNLVATSFQGSNFSSTVKGLSVKETINVLGDGVMERKFIPKYNTTYVYINVKNDSYLQQNMNSMAFAFKIIKK
jgi:hypothetical protein